MKPESESKAAISVYFSKRNTWNAAYAKCCNLVNRFVDFLVDLLYENGVPSLTRLISIAAFAAFLVGSAYLMLKGQRWDHYETFAMLTGGGGVATQVANKVINSMYNSSGEEFPDKKNGKINRK